MTRKHFTAIAAAFQKARELDVENPADVAGTLDYLAVLIADVCNDANPHFDERRFIDACRKGAVRK